MLSTFAPATANRGSITCKKFTIHLELETDSRISSFVTSTIRGGFGITLRKLVCPTIDMQCSQCLLRNNCVYCYLFETTPSPDSPRLKNYKSLPHPFTLWCRQDGNKAVLELLLIGKAIQYLPYFIYTLRKLGSQGLGKERIPYRIVTALTGSTEVYADGSESIIITFQPDTISFFQGDSLDGTCTLDFYTPMLLRRDGKFVDGFELYPFLSTLVRRITSLYAIHCDGVNFDNCKDMLDSWMNSISVDANMTLEKNRRFSTRQQKRIDYDGFTGTVTLTGNIGAVMPWLKAGEVLAVGKNTAFGFGRYGLMFVN
ncbi:MAG: CRISPR system precrRNA processing endoribonuclease RAMP protein Cas6 [Fibrobacterota bacterium]|nr:CRISPR system precrRNA processing endoribonuclease RAMP protein Cas6 [Chitinispirillaceae bacterium]